MIIIVLFPILMMILTVLLGVIPTWIIFTSASLTCMIAYIPLSIVQYKDKYKDKGKSKANILLIVSIL